MTGNQAKRKVLHVGCGVQKPGRLHPAFSGPEWTEVRLDINPMARPDLVASITDMAIVASGSMDAVFSSHNLEHLLPHEVALALSEFRRVLKSGGLALIGVPDLQSVCAFIARGEAERVLYDSPLGPVTPMDVVFGHAKALARGNPFMQHKTGFTAETLHKALAKSGFPRIEIERDEKALCLWAKAHTEMSAESPATEPSGGPFGNG